jgi:phospholipase/carboxylesterase
VFDLDDLKARAHELGDFIEQARRTYVLEKPVAVGYSNGANIASALMLLRPEALAGAVLMRGTVPFVPEEVPDLSGMPVLILSGKADPMVAPAGRLALAELLRQARAKVLGVEVDGAHGLTPQDITLAARWLSESR